MMINTAAPLMKGFTVLIALCQLFRLPVSLIAALAGYATCYSLNPTLPLKDYLLSATILFSMTAAACAINDVWDVEKDRINHPNRPLPAGRLSRGQAWWGAVILFGIAQFAALPYGLTTSLLVAVSIVCLWHYSQLLQYSGILGNLIVALIIALLILLGSLVAGLALAMIYPTAFLFNYALAREIIWDIHDAAGDRQHGVMTIANIWGAQIAFTITWALLALLLVSLPVALFLLPMSQPIRFTVCVGLMLLSFAIPLCFYQQQGSEVAYKRLVFWERLGMLLGIIGLLGAAPG